MIKNFAKIIDGIVVNVAVAEDVWPFSDDIHIEVPENLKVEAGWCYQNQTFIRPIPATRNAEPVKQSTKATPLQFLNLFTDEEQLAIVTATMQSPIVKLWYDKLLASTEVVFADPRVASGLNSLVEAGLISRERSEEVLPINLRSSDMEVV